ncbi:MAG TPA: tetratricopeptide repeat protein [Pirellulales bacterium]|jgi:tetratricopeptide (TPR) repeat protein|nr:tetratricopeptide repeat protein [Pirellulales bacterium]
MRRLNVKLSLWLVGITIFSVVGVHFLHGYQLGRNAEFLRVQAEKARSEGNAREAMKQYNQYLKHRDDPQGYSALAEIVVEIAKDPKATRPDKVRAYNILEEAIRRHPDLDDVRLSLIDYTIAARRYNDALEHIQYLAGKGKKDSALEFKTALCHLGNQDTATALRTVAALIGYDEPTGSFADGRPAGADEISAFELLAQIVRSRTDGAERARKIMQQMVAWNPESAKAHLSMANYLMALGETNAEDFKAAKPELERAMELAPEDVDVLVAMAGYTMTEASLLGQQGDTAQANAGFSKAQNLLDKALALKPDRQESYVRLSQLALARNDLDGAIAHLRQGIDKASDVNVLLERLVDVQFQKRDYDAVRATCKEMREHDTIMPELIRYQEARLKVAESNYIEAARELESIRPIIARLNRINYLLQLDLMLGRCYEVLNQPDRQLEAYRRVLAIVPSQAAARLGEATALQALGRHNEAALTVNLLAENAKQFSFLQAPVVQLLINEQMQKPEGERDWTRVDAIAELMFEDKTRGELDNALLKSELLMLKNKLDEAQSILLATQKDYPKDPRVWMTLTKLMNRNEKTRARVPQLIERIQKEIGEIPGVRAERIRQALTQTPENAVEQLKELEKDLDQKFEEPERTSLMMLLGNAYLQARDVESTKRCWKYVAEHDPKNASIRQTLFDLCIETKDLEGAQQVVEEVQESKYFGPNSPLYKYTAATEGLWRLNQDMQGRKGRLTDEDQKVLAQSRKLIDEALAVRGEWGVLWRVRGEIDQLEGDFASAIDNYQRSLTYSRAGQAATARRLVQLLYTQGRLEEANSALQYIGNTTTSDPLRKMVADIKERQGDVNDALAIARQDVEADPSNASHHIWLGQLLVRAGQTEEAEQAFRNGVELSPKSVEFWEMLVRHLIASKQRNKAVEAVREAAKSLAEDPLAMARLYERVDDKQQAEHYYKQALEQHPDDVLAMRRMVEFYLGANQQDKAVPYLDRIIAVAGKGDKAQETAVQWARRNKAQVMASNGDYENVTQAVKLIEQNAQASGQLGPDDLLACVMLLSRRPEPESRAKAAQLLKELEKSRPLLPREQTALAQLYSSTGKWTEARDLMLAAISKKSDDPDILINLATELINHDEYEDAGRWVDRLEDMIKPPAQPTDATKQAVRNLRARLLVHAGQKEQAVQVLESLVPSPLPQNQLYRLEVVSKMMESLGLNEAAERLLDDYMSQEPRGAIAMASYLGRKGDTERAFALLDDSRKNQPMIEILACALEGIRRHRENATPERYATLEKWAKAAMESEANKQQVQLLLAETYDLQGRYDDVIKIYRQVLADPEATTYQKALVKNNLAFVLAVSKPQPNTLAEAVKLADDAIRVLGPTSDLLDTRAVAYLAQGKVKEGLADLRTSVSDRPTGSKYFHLAQAEKQAGNVDAARTAFEKAKEFGLDANQLTPIEIKTFEQLSNSLK